jgi:enamine deaminase RidA (YjgF/YER057c/UK114 family)
MAHQQERNRGVIRVILEQDAGFTAWLSGQFGTILQRFNQLETKMSAQTDKLIADVTALIDEAVKDITDAVAAAQANTPKDDPAVDELDARVTAATQKLKDTMAALKPPAPTPTPEPTPAPPAANPAAGL